MRTSLETSVEMKTSLETSELLFSLCRVFTPLIFKSYVFAFLRLSCPALGPEDDPLQAKEKKKARGCVVLVEVLLYLARGWQREGVSRLRTWALAQTVLRVGETTLETSVVYNRLMLLKLIFV